MAGANSVSGRAASGRGRPDAADRVERWIARELRRAPPKAKSLIVTVWGDAIAPHGGAVWLSGLIRLLAPFGLSERLVRTAVYRLVQEGWLEVKPLGRRSVYRLTAEGGRRFEAAYRRVYAAPVEHWDGTWELVMVASGLVSASKRAQLQRQLRWHGFGAQAPHCLLRPARSSGPDRDDVLAVVEKLGVANGVTLMTGSDALAVGAASFRAQLAQAWDLVRVAADYRDFGRRFAAVAAAFADGDPSPENAFVVRTLLMHSFRRVMLHDPQLPPALLPARWPGAAAYALCRDFYRRTHGQAEAHLAATLRSESGGLPPAADYFYRRFGGLGNPQPIAATAPPSPARRP